MVRVEIALHEDGTMAEFERVMSSLAGDIGTMGARAFPATAAAFGRAAREVQRAWQNWAMGGSLDGAEDIRSVSPRLAQSIRIEDRGAFHKVVGTDSRQMERIQEGQPEIRMKEVPNWIMGRKSRITNPNDPGKPHLPYLIIPFRWGTPNRDGSARAHFTLANTIPLEVYKMVRQKRRFARSERLSTTHLEPNASGEMVERSEYDWGDAVDGGGNVSGLYAFSDVGRGSTYLTFRVISANSKAAWVRREVPPNDVAGALARSMEPRVNEMVKAALEADLGL